MTDWFYFNELDNLTYLKQFFHRNKPIFLLEYENLVCVSAKLLRVRRVSCFLVPIWAADIMACSTGCTVKQAETCLIFLNFLKYRRKKDNTSAWNLWLHQKVTWNSTHIYQGTDWKIFDTKTSPSFLQKNKRRGIRKKWMAWWITKNGMLLFSGISKLMCFYEKEFCLIFKIIFSLFPSKKLILDS